jgi:long-subunit fatty acid transport protein
LSLFSGKKLREEMKNKFIILILSILFSFSSDLNAATLFQQIGISSSPNPVGSGARAVGMGGAFIAIADDATAASWNPSGLIQLELPELSLAGAYFVREGDYSSDTHQEINNTGRDEIASINYVSAVYPFAVSDKNMVVSVNYQRLYEFDLSFDYDFDLSSSGTALTQSKRFEQKGFLAALGLAYAVQVIPDISLGATFNIWSDDILWNNGWEEEYSEHSVGTQGGAPVTIDTTVRDRYSEFEGYNANVGLLWNINENLTFGAVIKTPFEASVQHEFRFKSTNVLGPPANATTTSQFNLKEDVKLDMPLSYGAGIGLRFSDALSFALDVYRTHWSDYILTDADGNQFSPIDGLSKGDSDVDDTTQVRLGGEYLIIGSETVVPIRGGLFYDPEPSHGSPEDFFGFTVGSGLGYKRFIFDIAYQLRWGSDVDTGNLINTSTADITQHLLLASVIVHF